MKHVSNVIIGAGPAGVQMGYFMHSAGMNYIILERGQQVGTFFEKYPVNRTLISVNKPNCGSGYRDNTIENSLRYDWNSLLTNTSDRFAFSSYTSAYYPSADTLVKYLNDFVKQFSLNVSYDTCVLTVRKVNDIFLVQYIKNSQVCEISASKIFVASGLQPRRKQIKSEDTRIISYERMPREISVFKNKKVLILGGGNAAFETANMLNEVVDELILCGGEKFAWNTHYPGYIRSINMKIIDSYYLKLKCNLDWTESKSLRRDEKFIRYIENIEKGRIWNMVDFVILCLGFAPSFEYIDDSTMTIYTNTSGFPVLTPFYESVSAPNVFFLGALSQNEDFKHGSSAFIHGFRYNARVVFQYISETFEVRAFPCHKALIEHLLTEMSSNSQLLHRFDFHGHIILFDEIPKVLHNIPLSCVQNKYLVANLFRAEAEKIENTPIITVHLGYDNRNSFLPTFRQPQTGHLRSTEQSVFIHPILRLFECKDSSRELNLLDEFHLPEEAFNNFSHPVYHQLLLLNYFKVIRMTKDASPCVQNRALKSLKNLLRAFYMHD